MGGNEEIEKGLALKFDFKKMRSIFKKIAENNDVVPVVVQDVDSKDVLIVAYVNEDALKKTLELGKATFWSTSRNELWTKGLTSGNTLDIVEIRVNCEQNSFLFLVKIVNEGACHVKGPDGKPYKGCYYRRLDKKDPTRLEFV
jgi:phosphoribosyl-AMP cyclohydrolase